MLYEVTHLRQSDRSLIKRWYTCRDMDLFVWLRNNRPVHFQLSFDKQDREKAISWDMQRGFRLYQVDTGEYTPDRYKKTPMLVNTVEQHDRSIIARNFLAACENIDIGIADFIYARLMEYPTLGSMLYALRTDRHHQPTTASDKD